MSVTHPPEPFVEVGTPRASNSTEHLYGKTISETSGVPNGNASTMQHEALTHAPLFRAAYFETWNSRQLVVLSFEERWVIFSRGVDHLYLVI